MSNIRDHLLDHLPSERERLFEEELHDLYRAGKVTMRFENGQLQYIGTAATDLRNRYSRKS